MCVGFFFFFYLCLSPHTYKIYRGLFRERKYYISKLQPWSDLIWRSLFEKIATSLKMNRNRVQIMFAFHSSDSMNRAPLNQKTSSIEREKETHKKNDDEKDRPSDPNFYWLKILAFACAISSFGVVLMIYDCLCLWLIQTGKSLHRRRWCWCWCSFPKAHQKLFAIKFQIKYIFLRTNNKFLSLNLLLF